MFLHVLAHPRWLPKIPTHRYRGCTWVKVFRRVNGFHFRLPRPACTHAYKDKQTATHLTQHQTTYLRVPNLQCNTASTPFLSTEPLRPTAHRSSRLLFFLSSQIGQRYPSAHARISAFFALGPRHRSREERRRRPPRPRPIPEFRRRACQTQTHPRPAGKTSLD